MPDDLQIKALLNFVSASPEGERNKRLFWAGCRMAAMVASRLMSEASAETLLVNTAIVQGLPEIEARKTARSALAAGRIG